MKLVFLGLSLCFLSLNSQANGLQGFENNSQLHSINPWDMLERTANAARLLNYDGQFIYQNGNQSRTVQISHMNSGGNEVARNIVLEDKPREVYSQGSDIVIFQPKNKKVLIEKRRGQNLFPAMLPTDMSLLKGSYKAELGKDDRIADRATQTINLIPNDIYRYTYKVWMDNESGLLLKLAVMNSKNEVLEQVYFNQVNLLNSQDFKGLVPNIDVKKQYEILDTTSLSRVKEDWTLTQMPAGYREIDNIEREVSSDHHKVNQIIFSDGIASFSLFIEPLVKGVRPKTGIMPMGSTNICANVVDGHQIIVVGEVPAATVQMVAKSVNFKNQTVLNK